MTPEEKARQKIGRMFTDSSPLPIVMTSNGRDKTSLDIIRIRQGDDMEDVTLEELMAYIKEKSDNIASAVAKLEELFAQLNIKED